MEVVRVQYRNRVIKRHAHHRQVDSVCWSLEFLVPRKSSAPSVRKAGAFLVLLGWAEVFHAARNAGVHLRRGPETILLWDTRRRTRDEGGQDPRWGDWPTRQNQTGGHQRRPRPSQGIC